METSPSASTPTSCATLNACPSAPHRPFAMANPARELLKKDNTYVYMCGIDWLDYKKQRIRSPSRPPGKLLRPFAPPARTARPSLERQQRRAAETRPWQGAKMAAVVTIAIPSRTPPALGAVEPGQWPSPPIAEQQRRRPPRHRAPTSHSEPHNKHSPGRKRVQEAVQPHRCKPRRRWMGAASAGGERCQGGGSCEASKGGVRQRQRLHGSPLLPSPVLSSPLVLAVRCRPKGKKGKERERRERGRRKKEED
uniref:Uncharacterized protein n=2 Tax=Oryza TaxID=4527 RepID=Q5Z6R3_ORYSJ|nr:hypothetical protein [Oryza sativa Japonica Group]BAD54356.1 hypothetical protein [Oryza sativa Japonica Group]